MPLRNSMFESPAVASTSCDPVGTKPPLFHANVAPAPPMFTTRVPPDAEKPPLPVHCTWFAPVPSARVKSPLPVVNTRLLPVAVGVPAMRRLPFGDNACGLDTITLPNVASPPRISAPVNVLVPLNSRNPFENPALVPPENKLPAPEIVPDNTACDASVPIALTA